MRRHLGKEVSASTGKCLPLDLGGVFLKAQVSKPFTTADALPLRMRGGLERVGQGMQNPSPRNFSCESIPECEMALQKAIIDISG